MLPGLKGSLLSHSFVEQELFRAFAGELGERTADAARRSTTRSWRRAAAVAGPAIAVRALLDGGIAPLLDHLGYEVARVEPLGPASLGALLASRTPEPSAFALLVVPWGDDLNRAWRDAVRAGVSADSRWCLCTNGRVLRVVDGARSYSRAHLEFDLDLSIADPSTFRAYWALLRAEALSQGPGGEPSLLHRVVECSERYGTSVRDSLRNGVLDALQALMRGLLGSHGRPGRPPPDARLVDLFEQGLTVVYRILFLLFAEARGLLPMWHPIFRDGYSVESLRAAADGPAARHSGLWESFQAICRLAHAGCHAGDLVVTPFNGRLFAPAGTPAAERRHVSDAHVRAAIGAMSTRTAGPAGRTRISYRDLGVEQLGAVYESVLDYRPVADGSGTGGLRLVAGSGRRKATGSFYTPRPITEYLVRRTLEPLVKGRSADGILELRVLDPSMGSGAFLVTCCRYLAAAYESALVDEGRRSAYDLDDADRAGFRRLVAQRCLFGVDLNPMAVQLARLSIWLATLAADRPLTFLDHHLVAGDSLVGASIDDLARQPPGGGAGAPARLPLYEGDGMASVVRSVLPERLRLALDPDDSVAAVRAKEATLSRLAAPDGELARWKRLADLWCACWFWKGAPAAPTARAFGALADRVLGRRSTLSETVSGPWLAAAEAIAAERRFLHWTFEFPEVFFSADGRVSPDGGFDAVVGNPPWDVLRAGDERDPDERRSLHRFIRGAGVYVARGDGHVNLYQLFVERAVALLRPGGRLGLVVPSGLATDHGARELRRLLIDRCDTDSIVGFDNRLGVFPIHRGLRFLLLTATKGRPTTIVRCRFGETQPAELDAMAGTGHDGRSHPVAITRQLLARLSGDDLTIPQLRTPLDLRIVERISALAPALGDPDGWHVRFGRELNATEDRRHFGAEPGGLPVVEGKHLRPFAVDLDSPPLRIAARRAAELLDARSTFGRPRLAYREVAAAGNRLTLIAAMLPAGVVTTHTVFCLKTPLPADDQWFLCGILNSYVANYLVRLRVTTHVTAATMDRLPVPIVDAGTAAFRAIVAGARRLATPGGWDEHAHARVQATAARVYDLTIRELEHVLGTFPLVDPGQKSRTLEAASDLAGVREAVGGPVR